MAGGQPIVRYQLLATITEGIVSWRLVLETKDNRQHEMPIRDGEEVPVLLELIRGDKSVFFDASSGTLGTGWNFPGLRSNG